MLHANSRVSREQIRRFQGQPVCVVLKDGSYYLGWITEIGKDNVVLSGRKGSGTMSRTSVKQAEKALVSGFMPGFMGPMLGGGMDGMGATAANPFGFQQGGGFPFGNQGAGNKGGLMDMIGKWWPKIQMGIGMVRTIMPLLGGLKL